jgi:DNA polymerase III alpha subunit
LIITSDDLPALATWKENSTQDLYVELTPGFRMREALLFSRESKLTPVATNRVHFVTREEYKLHRMLRAIDLNTTLSRLPEDACVSPNQWLASPSAFKCYYSDLPAALVNTRRIADSCWTDWDFKENIFPAFRALPVRGSPFICVRGSSAASLVAYCIGITDVDPVRNRLVFERFLNVARDDPPDIDVDFPWDEREAIIDSVFRRYGLKESRW